MTERTESSCLKLALVHPQFRPDGGAERAIVNILNAIGSDVRITVISRNWESPDRKFDYIRCNPFYIGRLWRKWGFIRNAKKILDRTEVDLIQSQVRLPGCHIYRAGGGVHQEWLDQRRRISPWHRNLLAALSPYHRYKVHVERKMYRHERFRAVICNSKMVRDEILRRYQLSEDKIHVIYNAVDLEIYHPEAIWPLREPTRKQLGIGETETVFLFVGSGFERKGVRTLLDSFAQLPTDCRLILVGKDKQAAVYQRQAKRLGAADRVHFVGMQPDVRPYYAAADAFVLPTLYDPFANVVLEAMACGLPVVTSTKCGAVDIIQNGQNGFVCDALDTGRITECMGFLRSPSRRRDIGTQGRQTVEQMSLLHMQEQLFTLYQQLIKTH